jgi:hypothetical protein
MAYAELAGLPDERRPVCLLLPAVALRCCASSSHLRVDPTGVRGDAPSVLMSERHGTVGQCDHPNWEPLLNLVGEPVTGDFMWMYEVDCGPGDHLQAYKHIDSRRYLHLDGHGNTYAYCGPERYRRVPVLDALTSVFACRSRLI